MPDTFVTIAAPNGIELFEATIATWKLDTGNVRRKALRAERVASSS